MRVLRGERLNADDVEGLAALYALLHSGVNDADPLIREGDERIGPLVRVFCKICRAPLGELYMERSTDPSRPAGIFVLWTQRELSGPDGRRTPYVLSAYGDDLPAGVIASYDGAAECRSNAHGRLSIPRTKALGMARKSLGTHDAQDTLKALRLQV